MRQIETKYMQYINPNDPLVRRTVCEIVKDRQFGDVKSIIFRIHSWVVSNIQHSEEPLGVSNEFLPSEVLKNRRTTCFGASILLCSMLRMFLDENSVFVVVTKKKASAFKMHAFVIVKDEKGYLILDPLSSIIFCIRSLEKYLDIVGWKIILVFNDKYSVFYG